MKMDVKTSAAQTMDILARGYYTIDGSQINIANQQQCSMDGTKLYQPDILSQNAEQLAAILASQQHQTQISIENCTAMEAGASMAERHHVACLNFASAKNPGGGFLNGAQAQEESLARASGLYPTQLKYFTEMYEYNRRRSTYLYSDIMIYSPAVCFFKDDDENLLKTPYLMDVLTSPAVNVGAILKNRPEEMTEVRQTMLQRTEKVLAAFALNGAEHLILGAWGCGVFQNNPEDVAGYFAHYLTGHGQYAHTFKTITFAIRERKKEGKNLIAFKQVFGV